MPIQRVAGSGSTTTTGGGTGGGGGGTVDVAPLGYLNVKDYGAVGDGTTDDSAAFQTAYTAAVAALAATWSGGVGGGETSGRFRIVIPPGRYKIVTPSAMMSAAAVSPPPTGLVFEGCGKRVSEILFQPATGGGNYLLSNNNAWRGLNFRDLTFLSGTSGAGFMHSTSNSQAQDYRFERCEWDGSWSYGLALDGTNNNSEILFDQCSIHGSWSQAFLYSGITGGVAAQDQFLNYWFMNCKVEPSSGTFLKFPYGGSINCIGGSYIFTNTGAVGTFFSMPHTTPHYDGAQRLLVQGVRFELRALSHKIIDCNWIGGLVHFDSCDDTAFASSLTGSATHATADYFGHSEGGPAVLYSNCHLVGQHRYTWGVIDGWRRPSVHYESCTLRSWAEPDQFIVAQADPADGGAGGNTGGAVAATFTAYRTDMYSDFYQLSPDVTVNWNQTCGAQPVLRTRAFKNIFGQLPLAGAPVTILLPIGAFITGLRFYKKPGTGSSVSTTWSYTVTTGTSTTLGSVTAGGTQWASAGFSSTTAVAFLADSDAKRTLTLTAANIDQATAESFVLVDYYG